MEAAAAQQAQKTVLEQVERKLEELTKGEGVPSNKEIEQQLENLKLGPDVNRQRLSETGQELSKNLDALIEDARRIFLEKSKDEDLQKAAVHASRAAQIARRHHLLTTEEGRRAMEQAQEGVAGGVQFAHLLVTSSEFRNELADALTVIQSSLRRTKEQPRSEPHPGREAEEEEEYIESEEEEEYGQQQGEESGGGQGVLGGGKGKGKDFQRLSQEQVDRKAQRFVRLLKRLQQKPQYQESLRFLVGRLRTAFAMGGLHAERIERQLEASEAGRAFVSETEQAKDHAIRLIEAWMEASLAPFFGALSRVNDQMQNDAATREELGGLGRFVEGQLKGTAFKESEERVVAEAKDHFGRVRERLLTHYDGPIRRVLDELAALGDTFKDNEAATVLQQDVNHLVHALVYDEQGQPKVKLELVKDLEVLLSAFLRKVRFVPVPRIAITTPDYDFVFDDIVLNIRELTPKQIHLETLTCVHDVELERAGYSVREAQEEQERRWKQGQPMREQQHPAAEPLELSTFTGMVKEHDRGLADLRIYGKGMCIDLDVEPGLPVATPDKPIAHALEIKRAHAKIHSMSLRMYESKHDFLYTLLKPIIKNQARKAIERSVEAYMCDYIKELDRYATEGATGQYPVSRPIKMRSKEEEQAGVEARQTGTKYTGTEQDWRGTKERETGWQQGQEQGQKLPSMTSAQTKMGYETRPTAPTMATVPVTTQVTVPVTTPVTTPLAAEQAEAPPEDVTNPMGGRE